MATFREALGAAVKAATCESIANQKDSWFGNLRERIVPDDVKTFFDTFNCTLCDNCQESEAPEPEFSGGQCRKRYRVFWAGTTASSCLGAPVPASGQADLWGPIGGIVLSNNICSPAAAFQLQSLSFRAFSTVGGNDAGVPVLAGTGNRVITASITSVQVINGGASGNLDDDCGDPPIISPPPGNISTTTNITYNDNGVDVTIPFGLIFAPVYFDFDGSLNVPIRLNGPLFSLDGDIKLFPDFELTIKPTQTGDDGPGAVDDPDLGPGQPDLDGDEPENGPDATIVGVYVRSQVSGRNLTTLIPDNPGPDILAPGVATVRFAIRAGGLTAWTNDIRVKGVNEFVYCPVPWGAVNVSVRSEDGWSNTFTVLRGRPLTEFSP